MRRFLQILAGIPITLFGLVVANGFDVRTTLELAALSIICTMGISLVIWLPVLWLVGWMPVALFELAYALFELAYAQVVRAKPDTPQGKDERVLRRYENAYDVRAKLDELAIARFVHQAQARGLGNQEIAERLRQQDWSGELIQKGLHQSKPGAPGTS